MRIAYSLRFLKRFQKLSPKIQAQFKKRLELFLRDSRSPILRNHSLQGDWIGCRAFSITGDVRAIYRAISKEDIKLLDIGTHAQVY